MFGKFKDFLNFAKDQVDDTFDSTLPDEFKESSNENQDEESYSSEFINPSKKQKISSFITNNQSSSDSTSKKVVHKPRFKPGPKTVATSRMIISKRQTRSKKIQNNDTISGPCQESTMRELDQKSVSKSGINSDTKKRKRKSRRNSINKTEDDVDMNGEEDDAEEKNIKETDEGQYYKELQKTIAQLDNKKIQIKKLNLKIKLGVDEKKKLQSENKKLEKELLKIRQETINEQNEIKIQLANANKDLDNQKEELHLKTSEYLDIKKKYQQLQDVHEKEIQNLHVTLEQNKNNNKKFHDLEKKHKDLLKNFKFKELEQQTTIEALTHSSKELEIELKDKIDEIETLKNTVLSLEEKIAIIPLSTANVVNSNKDIGDVSNIEVETTPKVQNSNTKKKINIKNKNGEELGDEDDDVESTDFGHISTDNDEFPFSQKNQKLLKVLRFNNIDMDFLDIFPEGLEEFHNFMKTFEQTMKSKKNKTKPEFYSFKDTLKLITFPKEYDMVELRKTVKRPFEAMCLQLCKSYVESGLSKKFLDQESMIVVTVDNPGNDTNSVHDMSLEQDKDAGKTTKKIKKKNNGKEKKFIRPIAIFASLTLIYQKNIENMENYSSHVDMLNKLNLKIESMIFKKDYF